MTGGGSRPVALVTGGVRRVGLAIARRLARAGMDLVVTYRSSEEDAASARAVLAELGADVRLERLDLDDHAQVESVGARLARELGRLDALVLSASAYGATPLAEVTAETGLALYRVNALAPLLLCKWLSPLLAESSLEAGGSIVAMADVHAMGRPRVGFSAYSMSKAALVEMVRSLARELAPAVRVNGIAPGVVAWPEEGVESQERAQERYLSRVPLGRAGTPEDAAEMVRWLVLDAGYVTGEVIRLDGGRWLA